MPDDKHAPTIRNKKARHEYTIEDTLEAGIVLVGCEVKSVRAGHVQLTGGFVLVEDGEAWLRDVFISPYDQGSYSNVDPRRRRKLLLSRREIDKLEGRSREAGWTLVPLAIYFKRGFAKLEIGVARGKRAYDKRETLRQRDSDRERERALATYHSGKGGEARSHSD
jgi:SsrA-binding protein